MFPFKFMLYLAQLVKAAFSPRGPIVLGIVNNEKLLKTAPLQIGRVAHKTSYFLRNHVFSMCCHNNCLLNVCGSIDRKLVLDI